VKEGGGKKMENTNNGVMGGSEDKTWMTPRSAVTHKRITRKSCMSAKEKKREGPRRSEATKEKRPLKTTRKLNRPLNVLEGEKDAWSSGNLT